VKIDLLWNFKKKERIQINGACCIKESCSLLLLLLLFWFPLIASQGCTLVFAQIVLWPFIFIYVSAACYILSIVMSERRA
jgi:hypothetical protein